MKELTERYQGSFFNAYTITRMKLYKHELPIENDKEKISRLYGYDKQKTDLVFEMLDKEMAQSLQVLKSQCQKNLDLCGKKIKGNIFFIGDQLTCDYLGYFQILQHAFSDYSDIHLHSCAVHGITTNQIIPFVHDNILSHSPVVVCILIGTNDCLRISNDRYHKNVCSPEEFKKNLEYLILLFNHYGSKIILNTLPPVNESLVKKHYSPDKLIADKNDWKLYNQIIANAAKTHGCMLNRPDCTFSLNDITENGDGILLTSEAQCVLAGQILNLMGSTGEIHA
ncbi:SGNH/GDSL hydrolase family protein [Aminipila terrae]|uniref:SGNH hydrolase-type esterase domain-containing protein n=1 Tax=Aminipila terrae TaxID=2697030 RepID=A0A6P1MFC1_9FIRM|nr:hypothetical protein [Aminipila terrae]QHI73390.1 hypothetical protein Ami3637_14315 [Aminipila terrae]